MIPARATLCLHCASDVGGERVGEGGPWRQVRNGFLIVAATALVMGGAFELIPAGRVTTSQPEWKPPVPMANEKPPTADRVQECGVRASRWEAALQPESTVSCSSAEDWDTRMKRCSAVLEARLSRVVGDTKAENVSIRIDRLRTELHRRCAVAFTRAAAQERQRDRQRDDE